MTYIFTTTYLNMFIASNNVWWLMSDSKLKNTFYVVRNEMEIQFGQKKNAWFLS